jgi:hypothetical protein
MLKAKNELAIEVPWRRIRDEAVRIEIAATSCAKAARASSTTRRTPSPDYS